MSFTVRSHTRDCIVGRPGFVMYISKQNLCIKFESVYIPLIFILERMLTAIFNKIVDNKILRWKLSDVPKLYLSSTLFLYVHEIKNSLWKMSECVRKQK